MLTLPALNFHISFQIWLTIFVIYAVEQSKTYRSNLRVDDENKNKWSNKYILAKIESKIISFASKSNYYPKKCSQQTKENRHATKHYNFNIKARLILHSKLVEYAFKWKHFFLRTTHIGKIIKYRLYLRWPVKIKILNKHDDLEIVSENSK